MYAQPKLIAVGKAEDVILGLIDVGEDLDGTGFPPELEFLDDGPDSSVIESRS